MKNDEELKRLYSQYLFRYAAMHQTYNAERDGLTERDIANQLLGVAFAYGRMLGLGMSRIRLDAKKATSKQEERQLAEISKKLRQGQSL